MFEASHYRPRFLKKMRTDHGAITFFSLSMFRNIIPVSFQKKNTNCCRNLERKRLGSFCRWKHPFTIMFTKHNEENYVETPSCLARHRTATNLGHFRLQIEPEGKTTATNKSRVSRPYLATSLFGPKTEIHHFQHASARRTYRPVHRPADKR